MRWMSLLAASLLLHVLFLSWASGNLSFPRTPAQQARAVEVALLAPPPPPAPRVVPKPQPVPRPQPKPKARPKPPPEPVAQVAVPSSLREAAAPAPALPEPESAQTTTANQETAVHTAKTAPAAEPVVDAPPPIDLPPSARLRYDVVAYKDQQPYYGNGTFVWESNGGRYRLTGEAKATLLFFDVTVLNFSSEGVINEFGAAPVLYTEKPWRKSATNTHFQHEQQKISFSATTASYPYLGGEQDRASVLWQVAGIARAEPEKLHAGRVLQIVVAGPRDAKTWQLQVLGQEEIDGPAGKLQAWHVARVRPAESYERRVDIWFAPDLNWYPVKLRETSANGDYLDLTLAELEPLAAQPAQPTAAK